MKEEKDIASMDFAEDLSFLKCQSGWDVQYLEKCASHCLAK